MTKLLYSYRELEFVPYVTILRFKDVVFSFKKVYHMTQEIALKTILISSNEYFDRLNNESTLLNLI